MHSDVKEVLLTQQQIAQKVQEIGEIISEEYKDKNLVMITVLKGAAVFLSDLMRNISVHTEIDFMVVSSYGAATASSGVVRILKDIEIPIEGKDVLIIEDILDSGNTLQYIKKLILDKNPKSIQIATLLNKPARRTADIEANYVGFVIPDEFVIGYGLDYNEKYRNLPYIGILKPEVYLQEK